MRIPNPEKFDTTEAFFQEIVSLNSDSGKSLRWLSRNLNWPQSLLVDILAGRKKVSLRRAIEFGIAFKIGAVLTERLVHLVLSESKDNSVNDYFSKLRERDETKISTVTETPTVEETQLEDEALSDFLYWSQGVNQEPLSFSNKEFISDDQILTNGPMIQPTATQSYQMSRKETWEKQIWKLSKNVESSLQEKVGGYHYSYCYGGFSKEAMMEIDHRLNETFRWIYTKKVTKLDSPDSDFYQAFFCMNPIVE